MTIGSWTSERSFGHSVHKATIRYAQRIIDLEPTDEAAIRIQMEAHLALGNRAAALRAYHRFAEVLERELAAAPGEAIGAMYQRLRAGTLDHDELHGEVRREDLAPVGESPFVGRDLELNQLNEAWNTAREGGAHPVLVTGEPGIGKSRLAREVGRRVRAEGYELWRRRIIRDQGAGAGPRSGTASTSRAKAPPASMGASWPARPLRSSQTRGAKHAGKRTEGR